jgi:Flp pilus assembly pilin Flp
VVAITYTPRARQRAAAGNPARSRKSHACRIHPGEEVNGVKNIEQPAFIYPQAAVRFRQRVKCRGQTLVEYALILAIISIVIVGVIVNLGAQVTKVYSTINSQISSAPSAANSVH